MRLKDVIQGVKSEIVWDTWQSGRVPRSAFPLSLVRPRHYSFGPTQRWRVCRFSVSGQRFRVWLWYQPDLEQYCAVLGEERQGDMAVLVRCEYHGTHPGWHVHTACGSEEHVMAGRLNTPLHFRLPGKGKSHRRAEFRATCDDEATLIAVEAFGLSKSGEDLF